MPAHTPMETGRMTFGDCVYDGDVRTLTVAGEVRHLSPRAFDLLGILLRSRPRALSKRELDRMLWPDTHVSSTSLAQLVTEIRKAIGDEAKSPRWIRTVFGFGYAFAGEVARVPSATSAAPEDGSRWWLVIDGREVPLPDGEAVVGRAAEAAVRIRSGDVSRHHARITVAGEDLAIEDLGSRNGTYVNGEKVTGKTPLQEGDLVVVGGVRLVVSGSSPEASTWSGPPLRE
jgi:DNA-binding winged helix-turn-helix (wHTH) protein